MSQNQILDEKIMEEVPLDLYATKGERLTNLMIDTIGVFFLFCASFALFSLVLQGFQILHYSTSFLSDILFLIQLIFLVLLFFYFAICEYIFNGQTPGKMWTQTKVVTQTGETPSFQQLVVRNLIRYIPFEMFSFLRSKPTGWHDDFTQTIVVTKRL